MLSHPDHLESLERVYTLATSKDISTVLEIALDLDVFAKIKSRSVTIEEASALWGMPVPSARALGQFLCFMELLLYRDAELSNSPLTEAELVDNPMAQGLVHSACRTEGTAVSELKERLLTPKPLNWYQMRDEGKKPGEVDLPESFYAGFHDLRIRWGTELASQYDFGRHKVLLDVGGASGGWCVGVREKFPHLYCMLFDIPTACQAAGKLMPTGHREYVEAVVGDFFSNELPSGADVILLANVLHDWTIGDDRQILRKVHNALPGGGTVLVKEFYVQDDWSPTASVVGVGQALMVLGSPGKSGWQPTYREMEQLLREEGFVTTERRHNLVIGRKAGP